MGRTWAVLLLACGAWAHSHVMDIHQGGVTTSVPLDGVRRIVFSGLGGGEPPAAPVAQLGTAVDGQILLAWTPVPGALEYRVYEVDPATGGETLLLATPATSATLAVPANAVRVLVVKAAR